jgi:phage shock protein E
MKTGLWIVLAMAAVVVAAGAATRNDFSVQPVTAEVAVYTTAEAATPAPAEAPALAEYRKITPEEAKVRMDSGDEVLILDVRTREEYDEGHIPGAVLLPNEEIGREAPALLPDKGAEILIYCRSGRRSAEAANKLVALGYTGVYDFGGIIDWPYEIEQ